MPKGTKRVYQTRSFTLEEREKQKHELAIMEMEMANERFRLHICSAETLVELVNQNQLKYHNLLEARQAIIQQETEFFNKHAKEINGENVVMFSESLCEATLKIQMLNLAILGEEKFLRSMNIDSDVLTQV